jgi:hypothetical protein
MAEILDTSNIPGTQPVELKDDNPWVSRATGKLGGIEVPASSAPDIQKLIEEAGIERPKSESQVAELAHEAREKNSNDWRVKRLRPLELPGGKDRVGNLMHVHEFCRKLHNILGPAADGGSRVFINTPPAIPGFDNTKMKGLFIKVRGMEMFTYDVDLPAGWKKICAIQVPYMSEWGVMNLDDHGLFKSWKYIGWRGQVLLRLILAGVITEEEAHKEFGVPQGNEVDKEYRTRLENWRRNGQGTAN